jgi:Bacterial protein of unknown function (DUF899)
MTEYEIETRRERLAAPLELLAAETALTWRSDDLTRQQQLPWARIGRPYRFDTGQGPASPAGLFAGRSQLLVHHFRFGPGCTAACPLCSAIADGFDGFAVHLAHHAVLLCADLRRALGQLDRALATASTLGMAAVAEGIQTPQAAQAGQPQPAEAATAEAAAPKAARNRYRQEGEYWTVCYEGSVVRLKDAKGLRHLARLLAHPAREFHAVDLAAGGQAGQAPPGGPRGWPRGGELEVRRNLGDAGALLDATAKAAYKARLDELRADLEEAEGFNDPVRAARARAEVDALTGELARGVGLGGRDRRAASHAERARLNVTRAIRATMANLARANPALGRHLASTIRTGRYCSYTPDPRAPIAWER